MGRLANADLGNTGDGNAARSLQYTTPTFNGFQASVLTAPSYKDQKYSGLGLNYAQGPLTVNFAAQSLSPTGATKTSSNVLAFQYNFGAATLTGGVVNSKTDDKDRGFTLGVKVPLGADSVSAGFSTNTNKNSGVNTKTNGFGAQYIKSLTKDAIAYLGVKRVGKINGAGKVENSTTTGLGIRYSF